MSKSTEAKSHLTKILEVACKETDLNYSKYTIKPMLKKKIYPSIKAGFYIQIQNFTKLTTVKKSKDNRYFRYYFRCIFFENRTLPLLEIAKWIPSNGLNTNDDAIKVIYRDDDPKRYKGTFQERLVTVINLVKLKL
jgi:hypothetical protein